MFYLYRSRDLTRYLSPGDFQYILTPAQSLIEACIHDDLSSKTNGWSLQFGAPPRKFCVSPHARQYRRNSPGYSDPIYDEVERELQPGWLVGVEHGKRWDGIRNPMAAEELTSYLGKYKKAHVLLEDVNVSELNYVQRLLINRPDYADMFKTMDGLEYNGLTLYSMTQAENGEPVWSNLYVQNIETCDNDIYVDPNLTHKVVIGEDGMSVFVYSLKDNSFQIRDKTSTDYVIEEYGTFGDLLSALIDTVK